MHGLEGADQSGRILGSYRYEQFTQTCTQAIGDMAHHAKIHKGQSPASSVGVRRYEQVAGMRIGMKETILKDLF